MIIMMMTMMTITLTIIRTTYDNDNSDGKKDSV